ncbi:MAG: cytochrome P460, partial [Hyphomicrobiales bacterium]|nr:cytochrome P460 [Hyphomicrobiales bacterium]
MKRPNVPPAVAILALLAALGGLALAAQDRYALQVPGGLAFSEFRGYEDWQTIAVSHNGDKLAIILGNPAMIEAYK